MQLPDEYNVINERLEPFWGIRPHDLRRIMADWEDHSDIPIMVFGKAAGKPIRILKNGMPEAQADEFEQALRDRLNILLDVEDDLPEFRAIISPGDTPNLLKDWELMQEAREAARKGTCKWFIVLIRSRKKFSNELVVIDIDGPPPLKHGWLSGCEPHTPTHRRPLDFYGPVPVDLLNKKRKTFIHDHRATMDPCYHPVHLFTSGQFLSHYEGPSPHRVLIPQFSSSTTLLHYDLLPIPPSGWGEERRDTPWEHKYDERLLWRGVNTGMMCTPHTRWRQSQRFRLVEMANSVDGDIQVLLPPKEGEENNQIGEGVRWPKARINPAMMDVSFAGSPVQCEEPTCEELRTHFDWRKRMDTSESSRYKYVIDVRAPSGSELPYSDLTVFLGRWKRMVVTFQTPHSQQLVDFQEHRIPGMVPSSISDTSIVILKIRLFAGSLIASSPGYTTCPSRTITRICMMPSSSLEETSPGRVTTTI